MELLTVLADNRLFTGFSEDELHKMEAIANTQEFTNGDFIFQAGDPGDSLYIIAEGSVAVLVTDESGEETEVTTLPKGSYFGEMEVIDSGAIRSAAIMAKEAVHVISFDAADLKKVLQENDHLAMLFYRTVSKELIRRLKNTTKSMGYYKVRSVGL